MIRQIRYNSRHSSTFMKSVLFFSHVTIFLIIVASSFGISSATEAWTLDQLKENMDKGIVKEISLDKNGLTGKFTTDGAVGEFVVFHGYDDLPSDVWAQMQKQHIKITIRPPYNPIDFVLYLILLGIALVVILLAVLVFFIFLLYRKISAQIALKNQRVGVTCSS